MANLEAVPKSLAAEPRLRKVPEPARQRSAKEDPAVSSAYMAGEDRYRLIAEAAYFRAERRGFQPGSEIDDWLAAEIEVDGRLEGG